MESEWDDPTNEVGWDHGFHDFIPITDSDDLLWELDSPLTNENLHKEFVSAFEHQWCQVDPYRLEHAEMLLHSWHHFSGIVKNKKRFLLDRTPPGGNHREHQHEPRERPLARREWTGHGSHRAVISPRVQVSVPLLASM